MFKFYFKKFDFRGFVDFIYGLMDNYGFWGIRFYPDNAQYFTEQQLTHVAPDRNVDNSNGFVWAWKKKEKEVRKVSFRFGSSDGQNKIMMTVDLSEKSISLDSCEGISSVQIEEILRQNIEVDESQPQQRNTKKRINNPVSRDTVAVGEIHNSQVHFGSGNISEQKNNDAPKQSLLSKYWWGLLIPLALISIGIWTDKNWDSVFMQKSKNSVVQDGFEDIRNTLDDSIFEVIRQHEKVEYSTMLEKQSAFRKYSGMQIKQESARIGYIEENSEDGSVSVLLHNDSNEESSISIWCVFDSSWQQKLSTIDADVPINFSGRITNYSSGIVVLDKCKIE